MEKRLKRLRSYRITKLLNYVMTRQMLEEDGRFVDALDFSVYPNTQGRVRNLHNA